MRRCRLVSLRTGRDFGAVYGFRELLMFNARVLCSSVLMLALMQACGGCGDVPIPGCPVDTVDVDGICRRGCSSNDQCLASERCELALGACMRNDAPPAAPQIVEFTVMPAV